MEDALSQIHRAAAHSLSDVNVRITTGGNLIGQGITGSSKAVSACAGNVDKILSSFGGVQGGATGGAIGAAMARVGGAGHAISQGLGARLSAIKNVVADLDRLSKTCADKRVATEAAEKATHLRDAIASALDVELDSLAAFETQTTKFIAALNELNAQRGDRSEAAKQSILLTSVNKLEGIARSIEDTLSRFDSTERPQLIEWLKGIQSHADVRAILERLHVHGGSGDYAPEEAYEGGVLEHVSSERLADRLTKSREEIRSLVNSFIAEFGRDINALVAAIDGMAEDMGNRIDFDEHTVIFFDTFKRLNEFISRPDRSGKLYQYLLELNQNMQIDSKEVKERFLSLMRDLAQRAEAMDRTGATKQFAHGCTAVIATVNKFSDRVKAFHDEVRKSGGSTESMNDLFSVDSSRINITGLLNPLDSLRVAVQKVEFFRNIAVFRSNLAQTHKEVSEYSGKYADSVGRAIGEAIAKIQNEYDEIIRNISDNKAGMGLEIDMYNESQPADKKISKEKLKMIYKWQCDARVGLYKTIEAIDMLLLHFTQAVTKNPDAVADLQKLLTATRIIAKWYDDKAGDNLIRVFEMFASDPAGGFLRDEVIDAPNFVKDNYNVAAVEQMSVDLTQRLGGDRANKLYERCRRAMEGVVVLKNIVSYFMTIGEKYGNLKTEKGVYMAPSNIYKNLMNYIWVSALDTNSAGIDILTDNNELKRVVTYEDTKVGIAKITPIDPEILGINFNRHSIDKLRILKCNDEFQRLRASTSSLDRAGFQRLTRFITGAFARLGSTKYILHMLDFGVYDLAIVPDSLLFDVFDRLKQRVLNSKKELGMQVDVVVDGNVESFTRPAKVDDIAEASTNAIRVNKIVESVRRIPPEQREARVAIRLLYAGNNAGLAFNTPQSLARVANSEEYAAVLAGMIPLLSVSIEDKLVPDNASTYRNRGFLAGMLAGFTSDDQIALTTGRCHRVMSAIHYVLTHIMDEYLREYSNSVFAVDDTYFILTIKAIAGKIMAVAGINSVFKNPNDTHNAITSSATRLIMGGADGDIDVIDDAVELYVRLPLLVEFYRNIFDNGNKKFKDQSETANMDNEQISFVPEVGNVWSGLIINIFDNAKHIDAGLYTTENMREIVAQVNAIYKHYKAAAPKDQLVRHIVLELIAEINRRYGVIKRQELLNYYKMVKATKEQAMTIEEANYVNNDIDILNETFEFEGHAPSDEYAKKMRHIAEDRTIEPESKVNKLTDYKIIKDFRGMLYNSLQDAAMAMPTQPGRQAPLVSLRERIRFLKSSIEAKASRQEKYDLIIKAIEESEALNHSSNDIFTCFHEFVILPLQTLRHMHDTLKQFILNMYVMVLTANDLGERLAANPTTAAEPFVKEWMAGFKEKLTEVVAINKGLLFSGNLLVNRPAGILNIPVNDDGAIPVPLDAYASRGDCQLQIIHLLTQMTNNSGGLVKLSISTTKRVAIDLSEYQRVCEYLISNVKYMIDKFTGLVPTALIDRVTSPAEPSSVYALEESLMLQMFNKQNKSESTRSTMCVDNLYKFMPVIAWAMFGYSTPAPALIGKVMMQQSGPLRQTREVDCMTIIRDSFMQFAKQSGSFVVSPTRGTIVSNLLFNARNDSTVFEATANYGLIQDFNTIVSHYLNDLYDAQSKKIYTKLFESFSNSALVDALNGQSVRDFSFSDVVQAGPIPEGQNRRTYTQEATLTYHYPRSQTVLSSTLAYVMRTMANRTHPTTGMKMHELTEIAAIAPHMLEKYRMLLPMYLRICEIFLRRCQTTRKIISSMTVDNSPMVTSATAPPGSRLLLNSTGAEFVTLVAENTDDAAVDFASVYSPLKTAADYNLDTQGIVVSQIDEIASGVSALIADISSVQKELVDYDSTVTLFFDTKKDFTKNFMAANKDLPFAPLSTIAMGFVNVDSNPDSDNHIVPIYRPNSVVTTKFLYGMRTLLMDGFKLSTKKIPYLKKLINDFNGYSTTGNAIPEKKFNDVLAYVGEAANFIYDLRFYNGLTMARVDPLRSAYQAARFDRFTYQEANNAHNSMALVESSNPLESANKIARFVMQGVVHAMDPFDNNRRDTNPRKRIILVNMLDLNVVPINIHSLMREVPLANVYNYAMTFDAVVTDLWRNTPDPNGSARVHDNAIQPFIMELLHNPYMPVKIDKLGEVQRLDKDGKEIPKAEQDKQDLAHLQVGRTHFSIAKGFGDSNLRFLDDIIIKKMRNTEHAGATLSNAAMAARLDTKLVRNIVFLTLVQYAIKKKVKHELDFINTRVVSNVAAVSNVITDATVDAKPIDENIFDF